MQETSPPNLERSHQMDWLAEAGQPHQVVSFHVPKQSVFATRGIFGGSMLLRVVLFELATVIHVVKIANLAMYFHYSILGERCRACLKTHHLEIDLNCCVKTSKAISCVPLFLWTCLHLTKQEAIPRLNTNVVAS